MVAVDPAGAPAGVGGMRTALAEVSQDGTPRAAIDVARYRAPAAIARLPGPQRLRAVRRGSGIAVRFRGHRQDTSPQALNPQPPATPSKAPRVSSVAGEQASHPLMRSPQHQHDDRPALDHHDAAHGYYEPVAIAAAPSGRHHGPSTDPLALDRRGHRRRRSRHRVADACPAQPSGESNARQVCDHVRWSHRVRAGRPPATDPVPLPRVVKGDVSQAPCAARAIPGARLRLVRAVGVAGPLAVGLLCVGSLCAACTLVASACAGCAL